MKKYYTTEELISLLEAFQDAYVTEVDDVELFDQTIARLNSQHEHINWTRERMALAEHVIGELYLMLREVDAI